MRWLTRDVGSVILLVIHATVLDSISVFYVNLLGVLIQRFSETLMMISIMTHLLLLMRLFHQTFQIKIFIIRVIMGFANVLKIILILWNQIVKKLPIMNKVFWV